MIVGKSADDKFGPNPAERMRWRFWSFAVSIVIEAPSFYVARGYARVFLQSDNVQWETSTKMPRDVRLQWFGTDITNVRRLLVRERCAGAFGEWKAAEI